MQNLVVWLVLGLVGCQPAGNKPRVVRMPAPAEIFPDNETPKPADLAQFVKTIGDNDSTYVVLTSTTGVVVEPELDPAQAPSPADLLEVGYEQSQFLVDSRWATVRFLGPNPAGAGLVGRARDEAQLESLGKANDTIPVVTAAWSVHTVMEEFFAPLLRKIPEGEAILSAFKIQGAYYSPLFQPDSGAIYRDNAFLSGLQLLQMWPSGCFEVKSDACVEPFMSAGHDPTVIVHEVGHAVFNHLRGGVTLEGFQWVAVNEGFADYFSAAHFNEPKLGRIWKIADRGREHRLRLVGGTVSAQDDARAEEVHAYGSVWSSVLWNIRYRLIAELQANPSELNAVFLYAIRFLGESELVRLGDAGIAVVKANQILGRESWKKVIVEEMDKADILLEQERQKSSESTAAKANAGKKAAAGGESQGGCGVIAHSSGAGAAAPVFWFLGVLAPWIVAACRRCKFFVVWCMALVGFGCVKNESTPPGEFLVYDCDAGSILQEKNVVEHVDLYLTWLEQNEGAGSTTFLVSNERFLDSPSSVKLVVDSARRKIDQIRDRSGSPLAFDLVHSLVSLKGANQQVFVALSSILVEAAPQRILNPNGAEGEAIFRLGYNQSDFVVSDVRDVVVLKNYGPLPRAVVRRDKVSGASDLVATRPVCTLK